MTARQRIDLLSRAYPRLFPRRALMSLLRDQLGSVDALDRWVSRGGGRVQTRAPKMIYHVCAGNLAISACTSLAHGLLLGSHNIVKLPSQRDDSTARQEILDFIRALPGALRKLIATRDLIDDREFKEADAIIAFGSDATIESLRARTRGHQSFIAHGHAVSLLWVPEPDRLTAAQARACAIDILTYDQLGCLSPQAIYFPGGADLQELGEKLSIALERQWERTSPKPPRPLSVAARIVEARDLAHAQGDRCLSWLPRGSTRHLGWTLIYDPDPLFKASPLHGVIYLRPVAENKLRAALAPVAGRISTVGLVGKTSSRLQQAFLSLGVSRFCAAGRMQFPPLSWHHDGRPALADLVTWIDDECP